MMKTRKLPNCLFMFFIVVLISCTKEEEPVIAAFEVSETEVETGETVTFTNESVNANYYQWDFGDGEVSVSKDPTHVYSIGGDYDVKLIAIGDGSIDSTFVTMNVTASNLSIYEGVGIEGVDLYDTWSQIKTAFTSDTVTYIYDYTEDYGFYLQYVYFYEEGAIFAFYTETTVLDNSDPVYYICLVSPYIGATAKSISIGSTLSEVKTAYGNPENEYDGGTYMGYWYDSLGIDFYTEAGSSIIDEIDIYEATESSSSSFAVQRLAIQDIVKRGSKTPFLNRK